MGGAGQGSHLDLGAGLALIQQPMSRAQIEGKQAEHKVTFGREAESGSGRGGGEKAIPQPRSRRRLLAERGLQCSA